jgi:hypothetical protein
MLDWHELKQAGDEKHRTFIEDAAKSRRQVAAEPQSPSGVSAGVGQLLTAIKNAVQGLGAQPDFDASNAKPSSRTN